MSSVTYFSNGKYLAASSYDGSISIIDNSTFTVVRTITAHSDWIISVVGSMGGNYLASGSGDKMVKVWKLVVN
jgi:WD40 repeat protein